MKISYKCKIRKQLYQLLADHIASFFEVRVVSIYRRCRDDYLLSWFHVLTFMMDVPFLAAWFSDAFSLPFGMVLWSGLCEDDFEEFV